MQALVALAAIAALVAPSLAHAVPRLDTRGTGLKVELSQGSATEINAVLMNTGSEALKLLDYGTLMDKNPVQKLNVFKDGEYSDPIFLPLADDCPQESRLISQELTPDIKCITSPRTPLRLSHRVKHSHL
jgi:hypothetical protein